MLHIGEVNGPGSACQNAPQYLSEIRTSAPSDPEGIPYYVYILGTPEVPGDPAGLRALGFGIEYEAEEGTGLQVQSWNSCVGTQFKTETWPASGSGTLLIWNECATGQVTVGGYFYVTAYSPATMSIVNNPSSGVAEQSTCSGATYDLVSLEPGQIGWVSMGGGAIGLDTDGCNPALEPCDGVTAVRPATWGSIKARYSRD